MTHNSRMVTPHERKARAIQVRGALEDGVIRDVLDDIERQFVSEWKVAASVDERENCHRTVKIIGLMRSHLASIVQGEHDGISAIKRVK